MINELGWMLPKFGGPATHTCCFLHIVNLVAKSLIRQFDVKKKDADAALDEAELVNLKEERDRTFELEEDQRVSEVVVEARENNERWVDEVELMSEEQQDELEEAVLPVKLALTKASTNQLETHQCADMPV